MKVYIAGKINGSLFYKQNFGEAAARCAPVAVGEEDGGKSTRKGGVR